MNKAAALMAVAFGLIACEDFDSKSTSLGEPSPQSGDVHPDGKGGGTAYRIASRSAAPTNGILYHGGPVMRGTVNAYYIWYGNWSGNTATTILSDFINNFGGSPYYNINTTYFDTVGPVANSVHHGTDVFDNYSRGTALSDADIQTIVGSHAGLDLPLDTNGVYFVLTSADVNETTGFCTVYCGWHTNGTIAGADIKYSFVGNPDRCPAACAAQSTGPNGNLGADGMASIIAHEFEESTSDPDLNAWYDANGAENADKCAWTFGTEYTAANGARANMRLGARDFLIQQNWVNASGGFCALSFGAVTPDFSLAATPSSQTVTQGASTSYTVNITRTGGFTGGVTLSVSGLPSGASGSFSPNPSSGASSTLSVTTAATTPAGSYPLTITGVSGSLSHTASATLVVNVAATPNFSLAATPSSQTVNQGTSTSYTVNITRTGGFTGAVTFSVSGLPSGAGGSFSPNPSSGASSTLSVTTAATTPAGSYPLTITGVSGSLSHTASATLVVTVAAAPNFSLAASPSSRTINRGQSTTYTVNITRTGGFTGAVTLSVSGLPSGAGGSFSPNPSSGASATLTVTTTSSTATGTFALTVTGTSGALTHTAAASLTVNAQCTDGNCQN